MSAPTVADIEEALRKCIDPELGIDIISLGLVYDIALTNGTATVTMTLTTPGCPLAPYFQQRVVELVTSVPGITTTNVVLTFTPPWNPDHLSADAKRQLTLLRG